MDLKKVKNTVEQADGLLASLKTLLFKHWGILLLLGAGYLAYWFCGLVVEEMEKEDAAIEELEKQLREEYPEDYYEYEQQKK